MTSGIYMLLNLVTEMYYIGQAIDFDIRWKNHINELNRNRHGNSYLQHAWNKYGESSFKFYVIELTPIDKITLNEREQFWLDRSKCYDRAIGYNLNKIAESCLGVKRTLETRAKMSAWQVGRKRSEETKAKIGIANKLWERTEEYKNKMSEVTKGKFVSKETKLKMSISAKAKWKERLDSKA